MQQWHNPKIAIWSQYCNGAQKHDQYIRQYRQTYQFNPLSLDVIIVGGNSIFELSRSINSNEQFTDCATIAFSRRYVNCIDTLEQCVLFGLSRTDITCSYLLLDQQYVLMFMHKEEISKKNRIKGKRKKGKEENKELKRENESNKKVNNEERK